MTKVGITIHNRDNVSEETGIFNNGINQNILFLYRLLEKEGYETYFLSNKIVENSKYQYMNIYTQTELNSLDYFICAGLSASSKMITEMKKNNVETIKLHLGNACFSHIDHILHNTKQIFDIETCKLYDKVWISPHFAYSIDYYKYIHQTEHVEISPYIWEPTFLQEFTGTFDRNKISIGIFESNINLNKSSFIPMIIADKAESSIDTLYVFNTDTIKDNKLFTDFAKKSTLVKNKKMTFESRYPFVRMMNTYCNVVVSFQEDCELNYLYLECLYLGIPLIHNSSFLKEYGYYYEKYDTETASKHIKNLQENGFDRKKYMEKSS